MPDLARDPGPGACTAVVGAGERVLRLRLAEIERFEDRNERGFYAFFDALRGEGKSPTVREIRDLLALALVGGGLDDREADEVMRREGPDRMLAHLEIARDIMIATLIPAAADRDLLGGGEPEPKKKRPRQSKAADRGRGAGGLQAE